MATKKYKTLVIINPISGTNKKDAVEKQLDKLLPFTSFEHRIALTKAAGHATELAQQAAEENYDAVIAVGGDGTVHETAEGLINSETALGIIPSGSGNGLARHLQIPHNLAAAVGALSESEIMPIDVCLANDRPFFNVAGIGYDATVAREFAEKSTRGLFTYVQTIMEEWFSFDPQTYHLTTPAGKMKREALMVTVANGSQFGNNAYIAPTALLDDGKMDICILRKFPHAAIPAMAYQLFSKGIEQSRYSECLRTDDLWVRQEGEMAHLDGEPVMLGKEIHFKVLPRALNIFAPKVFLDDIRTKYPINRPG